jgi:general L-amino acid transport system substrate-binding protein
VDVLARVRASGVVHCAGIVRPGIAVPSDFGKRWSGISVDVCHAVAAAVFGTPERIAFRPYSAGPGSVRDPADDIVFLSGAQLVGEAASSAAELTLGPVILHDAFALLAPEGGVTRAADLDDKTVCVEPGTPADRALITYFGRHSIELREHPFQEPDEMRQAYGDGLCDALAGPLTTLASVRADPSEGKRADRILPELLADDPIFAATPRDARWSRVVWWTFAALVDAEDAGTAAHPGGATAAVPGVPPSVGRDLGLPDTWARDALAAGGDYGELFAHALGSKSRFDLPRGMNALWRNGGAIFALHVE